MIEIKNLNYKYAGSSNYVFNDFSLSLSEDKIYGLLGRNGMGKSTLLYLIAGLLRQQRGEILVDGVSSKQHDPDVLAEIFVVPEEFDMPSMSLNTYVKMQRPFYPRFSEEVLENCLADFDLTTDINLNELSMGQKKKVFMSVAFAANTRYLIMDEPTNGMDIPSKSQFRKVMARNMAEGRTVIISTHQVHDVESLLDHILILDHSSLLLNKSVTELCDEYSFELRPLGDASDDVLYSEPSTMGSAVIVRRSSDAELTPLNLELLFNAVVSHKL